MRIMGGVMFEEFKMIRGTRRTGLIAAFVAACFAVSTGRCLAAGAVAGPASIRQKLDKVTAAVDARGKEGAPPVGAALMMAGVEPLLKGGRMKEAEELLDRVLAALARPPSEDPLGLKLSRIQKAMGRRGQSGVPPLRAAMELGRFEAAMRTGGARQVEESLDKALAAAEATEGADPLEKKLSEVRDGVKALEASGKDSRVVGLALTQIGPAIRAGDEGGVEAALDGALRLVRSGSPAQAPEAARYSGLISAMDRAQQRAARQGASPQDGKKISAMLERAVRAMDEGRLNEAEKEFNAVASASKPGSPDEGGP